MADLRVKIIFRVTLPFFMRLLTTQSNLSKAHIRLIFLLCFLIVLTLIKTRTNNFHVRPVQPFEAAELTKSSKSKNAIVKNKEVDYRSISDLKYVNEEAKPKIPFPSRLELEFKSYILSKKDYPSKIVQMALSYVLSNYKHQKSLIPTIIHQQYGTALPAKFKSQFDEFSNQNEGFLHLLWTDYDLDVFVQEFHPDIYQIYSALPLAVLRSDIARYLLLLTFGGIYSDLDVVPLRKIKDWADGNDEKVGFMVGIEVDTLREDWKDWYPRSLQFCQWTFASKPEHSILLSLKKNLIRSLKEIDLQGIVRDDVVNLTGPGPFTDAIMDALSRLEVKLKDLRNLQAPLLKGDIYLLPITAFSPGVGHMGAKSISDEQARVLHQFAGEWKNPGKG